MGCGILGLLDCDFPPDSLASLPAQFEEWEQVLSRFRGDSELCQLNQRAGTPVAVSQVLWDVFQAALEANQLTNGLVNPLILDALVYAGYDQSFDKLQSMGPGFYPELDVPVPSLNDITTDATKRSITLAKGTRLDFGGIGKGWAAERAAQALQVVGPTLVSAGGDIAVSGLRANGEAWTVDVEDPFHAGAFLETLYIEHGGVATSGKDYRHWTKAGIEQHHIIDPHTGLPAETDILTATVVAPSAMIAEAIAKAVLISGSEAGMAWLESDDSLAGLLILENGQLLYSKGLEQYL
jgi:FAD:protein FMN transferase